MAQKQPIYGILPPRPLTGASKPLQKPHDIDEHDNGVQLSAASTFVECFPRKVRTGGPHPHTIVETTAMNAVEPPDVKITLAIPESWIDNGALSCVQMEAVVYACQSHEQHLLNGQRRGYLIGDGAGVGKGRTIAGIIVHNYELGRRRAIWLSVSSDLRFDAARDVEDVAGPDYCPIHCLSKFKYGNIREQQKSASKGIMFATYASLVGRSKTGESRLSQLIEWFGRDYDGCIIFDECHRAKNLCPKVGSGASMIGKCVVELQRLLPEARIVYASATGATEPRNMAYMERLGIWGLGTVFREFNDFLEVVNKRGIGAMELCAMDMKRRGLYIARQLSFHGVDFNIHEVPLTSDFKKVYDDSVAFWAELHTQFSRAFTLLAAQNRKSYKNAWTHYYSACQRFFKHLCIAVKVPMCVEITKKALEQGKCVVIGLQATGESQTNEALEENEGDLETFVSTPKQLLISLIEKYFPTDGDDDPDGKDPMKSLFNQGVGEEKPGKRRHQLDFENLERVTKRRKLDDGYDEEEYEDTDRDKERDDDEDDEDNVTSDDDNSHGSEEEEEVEKIEEDESGAEDAASDRDNFVQELLNELSSDDEDEDRGGSSMNNSDTEGSPKYIDSEEEDERAIQLFCADYSKNPPDPWAKRQRLVSETSFRQQKQRSNNSKIQGAKTKKVKKSVPKLPTVEKISDYAKKITNELKSSSTNAECSPSESYDSGFQSELFTMDLSKIGSDDVSSTLQLIKEELIDRAQKIGETLPINTLDALIDQLGGPDKVAEMTGRRGRVVRDMDGQTAYKRRNDGENVNLDLINIQEKDYFMNGEKLVAIISEAASSGISLHADRRALNKRKRVHITLELPWSADRAVQQFGRTHRSNQEYPPEYLFLISELAGEKRFVSTASKRLQSLGALTRGDRRAVSESDDLSRFSIENKYGKRALQLLFATFMNQTQNPLYIPKNSLAVPEFFKEAQDHMIRVGILRKVNESGLGIDKEGGALNKFLNRLLLMPVDIQNAIFDYYMTLFGLLIRQAKNDGTYDTGTLDLGSSTDHVSRASTNVYGGYLTGTYFEVFLHRIDVDRGMNWDDIQPIASMHSSGVFAYTLLAKTLPVLKGRTPVQCYADFMRAFRDNFKHLLGDTIVEIQVGMGPAGELRYPSYPEQNGTWKFPGIGAFQCYDKYMLSSLKAAADAASKSNWGSTGPTDAGEYNNWPEDTNFFRKEGGGWDSEYGEFFLTWYSQMLLDHGDRILTSTKSVFDNTGVKISVKVAGIHWHYGTRSHAPELTAGYYNTRNRDGYLPIAQMLARHGAVFNFTCIEMRDHEQPQDALCAPEKLVNQVALATQKARVHLAGENALPRYDEHAHEQILKASQLNVEGNLDDTEMCAFTYLRMNQHLFQPDNWRKFVAFVKKMNEGKSTDKCWEQVEREADHFVHVTQPLVQEAVAMMH